MRPSAAVRWREPAVVSQERMGTLFIVGTPIGNLEDITLRALRVLREVSLIAAEDTRVTRRLLTHFAISTPVTSYHEHSGSARLDRIVTALRDGDVALVSDAGMPGISDPGFEFVSRVIAEQLPVVVVPGPSSVVAALAASGLPTESYLYLGFLPRRGADRRRALERVATVATTLVVFEAPHRLAASLADAASILGDRRAVVARELTKVHEQFHRGTLAELAAAFDREPPRGECTIVIGGAHPLEPVDTEANISAGLVQAHRRGLSSRDAVEAVARELGLSRRVVYAAELQRVRAEGEE